MTPIPPLPAALRLGLAGPIASGSHAIDFSTWGPFEWVLYSSMALVCIAVLWKAVVMTVRPGEDALDHVKRMILADDAPRGAVPSAASDAPAAPPTSRP